MCKGPKLVILRDEIHEELTGLDDIQHKMSREQADRYDVDPAVLSLIMVASIAIIQL